MTSRLRKALTALGVILFWILLWAFIARITGRELLLPSPLQVLKRGSVLVRTGEFWLTTLLSIARVSAGIAAAILLGVLLAALTQSSSSPWG